MTGAGGRGDLAVTPNPADAPDTLLVVDDEPQIRRAVRNALAGEFARVVDAADGAAALDLAAAERPAFVVLDLGLPDGPGVTVCRELRVWLAAPILVLSARHADAEKVALLDAGAWVRRTSRSRTCSSCSARARGAAVR